jgi:hypothetical protein
MGVWVVASLSFVLDQPIENKWAAVVGLLGYLLQGELRGVWP